MTNAKPTPITVQVFRPVVSGSGPAGGTRGGEADVRVVDAAAGPRGVRLRHAGDGDALVAGAGGFSGALIFFSAPSTSTSLMEGLTVVIVRT